MKKLFRVLRLFSFHFIFSFSITAQTSGDVVINEFIISPSSGHGKEYIELLTVTNNLDLRNWTLSDAFSRATNVSGSTNEGDFVFPNRNYLSNVPAGTYIIIELSTPDDGTNPSELSQDTSLTDTTPRRLVLKPSTPGVTTSGVIDLTSSADNLLLFSGTRTSGTLIDQIGIGTSASFVSGSNWGDNNGATTAENLRGVANRSYSFIPADQSSVNSFKSNNDTLRFSIAHDADYKSPGMVNQAMEDTILISGYDTLGFVQELVARIFLDIPDSVTNAFVPPTNSELNSFKTIVENVMNGNFTAARDSLKRHGYLSYRFIQKNQNSSDTLIVIREKWPVSKGWGTYIFNPTGRDSLMLESPHPIWDSNSWRVAISAFEKLKASWFIIAGTHRYANKYSLVNDSIPSDVAHYPHTWFHVAHKTIGAARVLQIHGFAKTGSKSGYPDVVLSNGSTSPHASLTTVKNKLVDQGFTVGIYQSGDPDNVGLLAATQNEQGDWSRPNNKEFIHIESDTPLRSSLINRDKMTNAFLSAFPLPAQDSPLPIMLHSISYEIVNGQIILLWQTASEIDHAGFNVYKSGKLLVSYLDDERLSGTGNSTINKFYSVIDPEPYNQSVIEYYIESIAYDGSTEIFTITVRGDDLPHRFLVSKPYPNPFNPESKLNVDIPDFGYLTIDVFNVLGQCAGTVFSDEVTPSTYSFSINQNLLSASGTYFVRINYDSRGISRMEFRKLVLLK